MTPPAQAARYEVEEAEQGDLLAASITEAPLLGHEAEVETDDSPMFIDQHPGEDHRQKRSGLLSLFGGGRPRHEPLPPPLRDFRNDPTPVLQARAAAAAAQQVAQPAEEEHAESAEDLEIPSFLRRLAN
jgi:cell division protein FtsZ